MSEGKTPGSDHIGDEFSAAKQAAALADNAQEREPHLANPGHNVGDARKIFGELFKGQEDTFKLERNGWIIKRKPVSIDLSRRERFPEDHTHPNDIIEYTLDSYSATPDKPIESSMFADQQPTVLFTPFRSENRSGIEYQVSVKVPSEVAKHASANEAESYDFYKKYTVAASGVVVEGIGGFLKPEAQNSGLMPRFPHGERTAHEPSDELSQEVSQAVHELLEDIKR